MTLSQDGLRAYLGDKNVLALLAVIAAKESGGAYNIINGGARFDDFSRHPYHGIPTTQGGRAAGKYQFLGTTWSRLADRFGFETFGPEDQELGAIALIQGRGALADAVAGRFEAAVAKLRPEWTSLPGASESRGEWTMDKARALYIEHGGMLDNADLIQPAAPIEDHSPVNLPPVQPQQPETSMPLPLLAIVSAISTWGPTIAALIPQVATLFDRDKATPAKLEAAQAVVTKIVETTGAVNTEAAIGAITSDAAMLEKVRSAVITAPEIMPYVVVEVGPGIEKTQAANLAAQTAERGFWRNPAFWFVMTAVVPPLYGVVGVLLWRMPAPSEQLVTQVVTGILGLAAVAGAYYLGSTQGSATKTAIIANQAGKQ
jgi:muramidase (phage lysozyme)